MTTEQRESPRSTLVSGTGYARVRDAIRDRIISGQYSPGMRLKINDLSSQFGISTNPVREALQQLQGEGLVVILPNRGAAVRLVDDKLIRHIYEIGEALDGILANRSAHIATPPQVEKLYRIEARMERAAIDGDTPTRRQFNTEFHMYLGSISGNVEAVEIRIRHQDIIRAIRQNYGYSPTRLDEIHQEHRAIIAGIANKDPDAAEKAARVHCRNSCSDMLARYKGGSSGR